VSQSLVVRGLAQNTEGWGPCYTIMGFKKIKILNKLNGRDQLEDLDVDGNIISKWI
jgi:hypothetical protein